MRMLDLFSGRNGWGKAFVARGWKVTAVDLVRSPEIPEGIEFIQADIMEMLAHHVLIFLPPKIYDLQVDFICASSPCEEFSVHGMKHFHPNPKYPENGIKLFNHTRQLCEAAGVPYIMENVRPAQQFVGNAVNHCGPFYLWGNGVPPILPQGILKGANLGNWGKMKTMSTEQKRQERKRHHLLCTSSGSKERKEQSAKIATIPSELSSCVADYAERLIEQRTLVNKTT